MSAQIPKNTTEMEALNLSTVWQRQCKWIFRKFTDLNSWYKNFVQGIDFDPMPFALCSFVCVALLYKAASDLAPDSLTLDDQWVAILIKFPTMAELLELSASSPIGFIALQKALTQLFSYSELSLQILPLLFSLLSVVLMFALTFVITRSGLVSFFAASSFASSTMFLSMATRVKQYSLDAFVTLILLWLLHKVTSSDKPARALMLLASASLVLIFFSNLSLIFGVVAVNLAILHQLLDKQHRVTALYTGAFYNICAGAIFLLHLSVRANDDMYVYWQDYFVPLDSVSSLFVFMSERGLDFLSGALAPGIKWAILLIFPGTIYLYKKHILLLSAIAFFYLAVFVASALGKFPIGTGRTDIFSYPVTIFLITMGVLGLVQFTLRQQALRTVALIIASGIAVAALISMPKYHYPYSLDAKFTRAAYSLAEPNDALVAFPYINYALGFYGPYDAEIVPVDYSTNGFEVRPERANTYVLPEGLGQSRFQTDSEVLLPALRKIIDNGHKRIIYLAGTTLDVQSQYIQTQFIEAGYEVTSADVEGKSELIVFERSDSSP